ncbi:MAG: ATP-binding protein [Candidatus Ratteibacteria bacterium]|nr:ATP-binding protein [Candidatus Ratteibacteria bacterium]
MNYLTLKQIIIDQKEELESIFNREKIIDRELLNKYRVFLKSGLIKVITGPRRAGKSILCYQLLKGKRFAYINFDDENLAGLKTEDLNLVLRAFYELYEEPEFILLDEVQNIEKWELFVNRLKRQGFNLVITGSNARLLSKELATHLTGRHFSLELFPFSFREFLKFRNLKYQKEHFTTRQTASIRRELEAFLLRGGFPESLKELNQKRYLLSLYSTVLTKDTILRHKIRHVKTIKEFSNYLISNFSCKVTFNKLKNIFSLKSTHTAQNYLHFLEECYLIFLIERFSFKTKEKVTAPRKVYAIDTGLINVVSTGSSKNIGRLYENSVAVELMRRKALSSKLEIYYWQDYSGKEVDFVLKEGPVIKELIQVCYDIENYDTKMREFKSLIKAGKEMKAGTSNLLVITSDYEGEEKFENRVIKFIPLWKWLLQ